MMLLRHGFIILVGCIAVTFTAPATYDQRQTGDLNVQIHLKDLQVVALVDSELLDDYTDYDYFYDYADFTIKPIVKPTISTTSSVEPWSTWPTNPSSSSTEKSEESESIETSSQTPSISSTTAISNEATITEQIEVLSEQNNNEQKQTTPENSYEVSNAESNDMETSTSIEANGSMTSGYSSSTEGSMSTEELSYEKPVEQLSRKRCRSGFSPDGKGRCRRLNRRRLSFIPFALKFSPKLLAVESPSTKNASH